MASAAMKATDVDHMYRAVMHPDKAAEAFQDPDILTKIMHFTPHDELDIYDAVDVTKQPDLRQEGKVVIVTGAGRGIGRAVAIEFAKASAKAIAIAARTVSQLEEVKQEIHRISPRTEVYLQQVNVGDEGAVKSLYNNVQSKFGAIDVVVSNAGAQTEFGKPLVDTDTEKWWNDFVTNTKGTYLIAKYFAQALAANDNKKGTFINISSGNAVFTAPGQSSYCANKAAGLRLCELLHIEVPNLRVFNLHPGVVETQMVHDGAAQVGIPLTFNWTSPALTGATCLWLSTERAEFLRGRFVSVNWRVDELEGMKGEIEGGRLLKSGVMGGLGVEGDGKL